MKHLPSCLRVHTTRCGMVEDQFVVLMDFKITFEFEELGQKAPLCEAT